MKESEMSQTPTVPPLANRFMKFVLRSRLHPMVSKTILLITFTGRKSGKTYSTPVSYSRHGDEIYVFTHGSWWKNLRGGAPVRLLVHGRELQGLATPVEERQAVAAGLLEHLRQVPTDAGFYGLKNTDLAAPRAAELEKAVEMVTMIRIRVC
jgi:deazaflavin-dependent oxidoreductase (nitroreductase family)